MQRKRKPNQTTLQRTYTVEQIADLKAHALELWNADNRRAQELGFALLEVRSALQSQHGAFKKWWQENKLSQARVSYCMRLASGKIASAKAKQRTLERIVISEVKNKVDGLLKFCVNPKHAQALDQIEASLGRTYLYMIGGIGRMRGWPRINEQDPGVQAAGQKFKQALSELLDAAFNPLNLEDLDRMHYDAQPASLYMTKKPAPNATDILREQAERSRS
jgi:hypothetical protein